MGLRANNWFWSKVGRSINGILVFAPDRITELVQKKGVTDILLAMPSAARQRRTKR